MLESGMILWPAPDELLLTAAACDADEDDDGAGERALLEVEKEAISVWDVESVVLLVLNVVAPTRRRACIV